MNIKKTLSTIFINSDLLIVIPTADAGHGCPNDWKCAQYCRRLACYAGYCKWWVVCTCSRCRGGRRSVENEVELGM